MVEKVSFRRHKDGGFVSLNNRLFADIDKGGRLHVYKDGYRMVHMYTINNPSFTRDAESFALYI